MVDCRPVHVYFYNILLVFILLTSPSYNIDQADMIYGLV